MFTFKTISLSYESDLYFICYIYAYLLSRHILKNIFKFDFLHPYHCEIENKWTVFEFIE